jgi:hypothetical protein
MGRVFRRMLICHPCAPCPAVGGIEVTVSANASGFELEYVVTGAIGAMRVPAAQPVRAEPEDGLWQHTCFELFVASANPAGPPGYAEFNFSPSGRWASYRFDSYRQGMRPGMRTAQEFGLATHSDRRSEHLAVTARMDLRKFMPPPYRIGLAAVIEDADGSHSYWALAHPPGGPDFHHPDGFALSFEILLNAMGL